MSLVDLYALHALGRELLDGRSEAETAGRETIWSEGVGGSQQRCAVSGVYFGGIIRFHIIVLSDYIMPKFMPFCRAGLR